MSAPARRLVALLAVTLLVPLTGCARLCSAGAVTCRPRSDGDALNDPPRVSELIDVWADRPGRRDR